MKKRIAIVSLCLAALLLSGCEEYAGSAMDWEWSMARYEQALNEGVSRQDEEAREAWDELEKSVVSHVADDIRVSIRGAAVEMTIVKKLA